MDRFAVDAQGPVLVYLAEDSEPSVRQRVHGIFDHRSLDIAKLDVHVIVSPVLRLDLQTDQRRLAQAVQRYRPRLLLLDPLVRLHRLDENSASEISGLLGYLRHLQRWGNVAVVLVHHASKRQRAQPGQGLRGSSDLHAFGDSNGYLARHMGISQQKTNARWSASAQSSFVFTAPAAASPIGVGLGPVLPGDAGTAPVGKAPAGSGSAVAVASFAAGSFRSGSAGVGGSDAASLSAGASTPWADSARTDPHAVAGIAVSCRPRPCRYPGTACRSRRSSSDRRPASMSRSRPIACRCRSRCSPPRTVPRRRRPCRRP
ncbi:MAG: AAA family ATPase [Deltaproteobacteria bacterium]|nr:AAA family ATPase [Deltaproteobacteria bacterium]